MSNRAVFLDKDGTLVEDVPYCVDPLHLRLLPSAIEGLRVLQDAGFQLVVVSNQAGVARGYFTRAALADMEHHLCEILQTARVLLAGCYWCPHHPDGVVRSLAITCDCRKPQPGLLRRAAREHQIDLAQSWMIGNTLDDVEAGRRAGCRTILLRGSQATESLKSLLRQPQYIAPNLADAAAWITGARFRVE